MWGDVCASCIEEVAPLIRPLSLHAIEALGRGYPSLVQALIVLAICQDWRGRILRRPSWECTTRFPPETIALHSLVLQPKRAARGDGPRWIQGID